MADAWPAAVTEVVHQTVCLANVSLGVACRADCPCECHRCDSRYGLVRCVLRQGHAGEHAQGLSRWGDLCGAKREYGINKLSCTLSPDHVGRHWDMPRNHHWDRIVGCICQNRSHSDYEGFLEDCPLHGTGPAAVLSRLQAILGNGYRLQADPKGYLIAGATPHRIIALGPVLNDVINRAWGQLTKADADGH